MWQKFTQKLHSLVSLKHFYQKTSKIIPYLFCLTLILFLIGSIDGLFFAPADYQQGEAFRIIYVHVPAAFMSLAIYSFISVCAVLILVWKIKLAEILLKVSVSIGLWMTFIALVSGSIWGKPMWGTAWIWDARLTSELILFFLYFAILAVLNAIRSQNTAARAAAIIVLLGAIDIPIVHYSVNWWNTLHQGATISRLAKPAMDNAMLYPLLCMIASFAFYALTLILYRARTEILLREKNTQWVFSLLMDKHDAS